MLVGDIVIDLAMAPFEIIDMHDLRQIQFFFKRDLRKIHVRAAQVFDRLRAHVNDVLAAADIQKEGRTTALFFRHAVRGAEKQQLHIAIRFFADKLLCFSKQIILFFKTLVKFFKTIFACSKQI